MEIVFLLILVVAVAAYVSAPWWRPARERTEPADPEIAALQARKEQKYREIRDLELDRSAGKVSEADFARADAVLRREAIEILRELDAAEQAARERAGGDEGSDGAGTGREGS